MFAVVTFRSVGAGAAKALAAATAAGPDLTLAGFAADFGGEAIGAVVLAWVLEVGVAAFFSGALPAGPGCAARTLGAD